jgi:hypothetical protein
MKHLERPAQISSILQTIYSRDEAEISTELEAYIADLEAKQPDRPSRIADILRNIDSQYSADIGSALESYISDLEARQQTFRSKNYQTSTWDPKNPPIWSHQHQVEREQHRRKQALQKQSHHR